MAHDHVRRTVAIPPCGVAILLVGVGGGSGGRGKVGGLGGVPEQDGRDHEDRGVLRPKAQRTIVILVTDEVVGPCQS